jgi:hypothetical protein
VLLNGFAGPKERDAKVGTPNKAETDGLNEQREGAFIHRGITAIDASYQYFHKWFTAAAKKKPPPLLRWWRRKNEVLDGNIVIAGRQT